MLGEGGCRSVLESLYLFLDGELEQQRYVAVQAHLVDCPPCHEAFEFEFELWERIAQKCREQEPPALRQRVLGVLNTEPGPGPGIGLI